MAIVNVNGVSESDGEVFKTLPAGTYAATIISSEVGVSKNSESKYFESAYIKLGVKAEDPDTGAAYTVNAFYMIPCTKTSIEDQRRDAAKLKLLQRATDTEDMGDEIDTDRFLHVDVTAIIGEETSAQYGKQNKVSDILPA